jgi:hypothetical protein
MADPDEDVLDSVIRLRSAHESLHVPVDPEMELLVDSSNVAPVRGRHHLSG